MGVKFGGSASLNIAVFAFQCFCVFQCDQYACQGIEVAFMMVNSCSLSFFGSQKGMDFLNQRPDILRDFAIFLTGTALLLNKQILKIVFPSAARN